MKRTKNPWFLMALFLLPALVSACGSSATSTGAGGGPRIAGGKTPLEGTVWRLEAYGDPLKPTAVLAGTEITATFDPTTGRVTGRGGCNQYFAGYTAAAGTLTVTDVGATKVFCGEPAGVMEQEGQYFTLLDDAASFQITDAGKLEITTAGGKLLRFVEKPAA